MMKDSGCLLAFIVVMFIVSVVMVWRILKDPE